MRYQPHHKPLTRNRIIEQARRAFLSHGQQGIGVDAIMNDAGLTAGGFYSHFESKDELFALAIDAAFASSMAVFLRGLDQLPESERIGELTRRYLSRAHRDNVDEGCPMPPLAADAARLGKNAQHVFETRLDELVAIVAPSLEARDEFSPDDQALALLALYAGGIALARATTGTALSNRILLACRKQAGVATRAPGVRARAATRRDAD